jgi:AhpD family alkylhydroperoxidase
MQDLRCNKKTFKGPGQFVRESCYLGTRVFSLFGIMMGRKIESDFRERLMLSVTRVNGCRWCNWVHTAVALRSGLSNEQLRELCNGVMDHCPSDQALAVLYAQHWADSDGNPEKAALKKLQNFYGEDVAGTIHLVLRTIRWGNFVGNGFDNLVCRLSFGRYRSA